MLFHQLSADFPLVVHCQNAVLKVGSELEMFVLFSPLPLPASHLLFIAQDSDGLYLTKDGHVLFPCSLGRLWMIFRELPMRGGKQ